MKSECRFCMLCMKLLLSVLVLFVSQATVMRRGGDGMGLAKGDGGLEAYVGECAACIQMCLDILVLWFSLTMCTYTIYAVEITLFPYRLSPMRKHST